MSTSTMALEVLPFPNYTELRRFLPQNLWHVLRGLSVAAALALAYILSTNAPLGLHLFWGLAVPLLPLVFFVAPGIWRNLCPMAASNQLPRMVGISRAATNSTLSRGLAYPLGILAFFLLVASRKLLFNSSGLATAILILGGMLAALTGGLLFKGKSGWCSSICPLLPVQRLYGQTPFVKVANTHCNTCLGCTKNCYDFNPGTAYLADQYDARRGYRSFRRFFAGVFPGFVLAYYLVPGPPDISAASMAGQMLFYMAISLALFTLLDTLLQTMVNVVPVIFAVAAINCYYWFSATTVVSTLTWFNLPVNDAIAWALKAVVLAGSLIWLWRSICNERIYLADQERKSMRGDLDLTPIALETLKEFPVLLQPARRQLRANATPGISTKSQQQPPAALEPVGETSSGVAELCIDAAGKRAPLRRGQSLLDAIESCGENIESGCRMGVCGADPIAVTAGMENLSAVGGDECATLGRLGYAENTRMACMARMRGQGQVRIELEPQARKPLEPSVRAESFAVADPAIRSVVVIGNGIAGVTAADHVRLQHPECEIHVISRERHAPYNRMGIARLINGRAGMSGLHLQPETWYQERRIQHWINTHVVRIDSEEQTVFLATGEELHFDRLILANGSSAFVPPIDGFGIKGSFVLREADEAMGLRDYIQRHECRTAIVAGAGLLGLEAAYALRALGLKVAVLSNTPRILNRQLDLLGGQLLERHLETLGIDILNATEASTLLGGADGRLCAVRLKDGTELSADIFLACTGIKPNVELAENAGIRTGRGILVDNRMQTSQPGVYAAGDVAEHEGTLFGLWPVALEQAQIAAVNALGGDRQYRGHVPSTMLKVSGIDLFSVGKISADSKDEREIMEQSPTDACRYRKLVIASGRAVGAILIGYPELAAIIARLIRQGTDLSQAMGALRNGQWDILIELEMAA